MTRIDDSLISLIARSMDFRRRLGRSLASPLTLLFACTVSAEMAAAVSPTMMGELGGSRSSAQDTPVLSANPGGPYLGTVGQPIVFNGGKSTAPSGQTPNYNWSFGDGGTATGVKPSHSYAEKGSYTVTLVLTDASGATSSATTTATIDLPPKANAGGPYSGTAARGLTFSGAKSTGPTGQTLKYAWSFGDGGAASGVGPTHVYKLSGVYTVTLTVSDAIGGSVTAQTTATIDNQTLANAGGTYNGLPGEAIRFNGSKSTGPAGQKLTYLWKFGDGASASSESPTHSYNKTGTYNVSLTVADKVGGTSVASTTATVSKGLVANPGGPYLATAGNTIAFSGVGSSGPAGKTLSYAWNFGDGSKGVGATTSHAYSKAGNYSVSLTVSAAGDESKTTRTIANIDNPPIANPGNGYTGAPTEMLTFNGSLSIAPSGQPLTYAWEFGDGATASGEVVTHAYKAVRTYTVSLTVSDAIGGKDTAKTTAQIVSEAVANPGGPYTGATGEEIRFSGAQSLGPHGKALEYTWKFGDGASASGENPEHIYTKIGSYKVSVTVSYAGGKASTAATTAAISKAPVALPGGPYNEAPGKPISFNGSSSVAPKGQTLTYMWTFGDGATGSGPNPLHSYQKANTYKASLTVTDTAGGTDTEPFTVSIVSGLVANVGGPYSGQVGQPISFSGAGSIGPPNQSLSYFWNFGDGGTGTGASPSHTYTNAEPYTVTLTVSDGLGASATASAKVTIAMLAITGFQPTSGPVGTTIVVSGSDFGSAAGPAPRIILPGQNGGQVIAAVSTFSSSSLSFMIPLGAVSGNITVQAGTQSAASHSPLTVTPPTSPFTLAVTPSTVNLIQGQTAAAAVSVTSTTGYTGSVTLGVANLPSGVTASFQPQAAAAGQVATLTLSALSSQPASQTTLNITGTATVDGQQVVQPASSTTLQVMAVSMLFIGRTVVDDAQQEPIAGVTVSFVGQDGNGHSTGCSASTVSDGGGNFVLTPPPVPKGQPSPCTGPQLISYNGSTATSPAGKYAGVDLMYTLVPSQVTASPVLVHLPRIDNAETVEVQQNAPNDQVFYFSTIPGLKVTVYAGTTLLLDDGSQPNPFPLVAISIPIDRLPDKIPTTGMLMPFIVAFQPANSTASQPVSVDFPNSLGVAAGTAVTFVTLDPTHGTMQSYGTGTVSSDGTEFVANADPNHSGHNYGLVHFDWHGPAPGPPNAINPSPDGINPAANNSCPCNVGRPVDVATGIVSYTNTDLSIGSARGSIGIHRYYRTLTSTAGPFGIGTSFEYSYALNTLNYVDGGGTITLATPDGNQIPMAVQPNLIWEALYVPDCAERVSEQTVQPDLTSSPGSTAPSTCLPSTPAPDMRVRSLPQSSISTATPRRSRAIPIIRRRCSRSPMRWDGPSPSLTARMATSCRPPTPSAAW